MICPHQRKCPGNCVKMWLSGDLCCYCCIGPQVGDTNSRMCFILSVPIVISLTVCFNEDEANCLVGMASRSEIVHPHKVSVHVVRALCLISILLICCIVLAESVANMKVDSIFCFDLYESQWSCAFNTSWHQYNNLPNGLNPPMMPWCEPWWVVVDATHAMEVGQKYQLTWWLCHCCTEWLRMWVGPSGNLVFINFVAKFLHWTYFWCLVLELV